MKNSYKYYRTVQYMDSVEIEDIGNCIIKAYTDFGEEYYLFIRTVLGVSRVLQIGPLGETITTHCSCYFKQLDYDDYKVDKIIDKFIDGNLGFTQIEVTDTNSKEDFKKITDTLPDIKEILYDSERGGKRFLQENNWVC